jgi:hypothetical protein
MNEREVRMMLCTRNPQGVLYIIGPTDGGQPSEMLNKTVDQLLAEGWRLVTILPTVVSTQFNVLMGR